MLSRFGTLTVSVLSAISAFCGIAMVLSDRGPQWSDTLQMTTYIGMFLLLIAYTLGSRLAVMAL